MNIFITGATGFIGSHVLEKLLEDNHRVTILTRKNSDLWRIKTFVERVTIVNESQLKGYFSSTPPSHILHFATHYVKSHQPEDVSKMIEANIQMPALLCEYALQHHVKHFINIGTCFEYQSSIKKISEQTTLYPYNLYASMKVAFENILKFYARGKNFRAVTLKLFYPYGEKDNVKVIPLMINSLLKNEKLVISKGEQKLDYTYVGDIVSACIKAMQFISSDKYREYEVINIGEGKAKQLKNIANILNEYHGKQLIFCEKEYPENDIMQMVANVSKAKRLLDWNATIDINNGLKKTFEYYRSQYESENN